MTNRVERTAHEAEAPATDDLDRLAEDTRSELARLGTHPAREVKRLARVADEGRSGATPFLLIAAVGLVIGVIVAVATVIGLLLF